MGIVNLKLISCFHCQAHFGIHDTAHDRLVNSHDTFYCPYCKGSQSYNGETEEEKRLKFLERDNDQKTRNINRLYDNLESTRNSLRTTKGHVTKLKKKSEES